MSLTSTFKFGRATTDTSGLTDPPTSRRGPVVRVVLGSLVAGAVAAALLTLGAFAGGSEATITGAAQIGFAIGWALLAFTSIRLTSQPQRWAFAPAAALGGCGVVLLAAQPGERTLTATGWFWPPLILAGVAWTTRQMRASLTGRARWPLYAVLFATAAAAFGGLTQTVAAATDTPPAMSGRLYSVGDHRLHMHCVGTGSPTVVLEAGMGGMSSSWARIQPLIAGTTRVCAYDRANSGWSDDTAHPQDSNEVATDLHRLLAAAHEHGPFVLVGHSVGGPFVLTYAARYPNQVAGMVLLDSSSPHQFSLPTYPGSYSMMKRGFSLLPSLTRLGVGRLVPTRVLSSLPSPAAEQLRYFGSETRGARSLNDELGELPAVFRQAQALTSFGNKPLVVLTASKGALAGWAGAQDELAALSTNSSHRSLDVSHTDLLEAADAAQQSARAITDVVTAFRTHTPVAAS